MAVLSLRSLYTNKVNTVGPLYLVYNQTLVSSLLLLLCGFFWAASGDGIGRLSSGEGWLEGGNDFVSLGSVSLQAICLKAILFQF